MLQTQEFLAAIWPGAGLYCLEVLAPGSTIVTRRWAADVGQAAQLISALDAQGCTVYHACAAYTTADNRKQTNVRAAKAFWVDLDVEEGSEIKYSSQQAAIEGLATFCATYSFPTPMVICSGGGFHCYWLLQQEITALQWNTIARRFKSVLAAAGVKQDNTRTADIASILRPVGSHHRKGAPRQVFCLRESVPIEVGVFEGLVERAAASLKVPADKPKIQPDLNSKFTVQQDFPSSSGRKVADKCAQIAKLRDTRGNIDEPTWYAGIQLIHFTEESDALAHEWSAGHPAYSESETDRKLGQIASMGPTTCDHFSRCNPNGCAGCPYRGKITSPIQLGIVLKQAPLPPANLNAPEQQSPQAPTAAAGGFGNAASTTEVFEDFIEPPKPFMRAQDGVYVELEGEPPVKIYDYDLFPVDLCWDEHLGYETVVVRHFLPRDGWKEFRIRSALVESPKEFNMALRDNHVKPINSKMMAAYMASYMKKLQSQTNLRRLWGTMGWKENGQKFILGESAFTPKGVLLAGISIKAKDSVQAFTKTGDLQAWTAMTAAFAMPGAEPYAFTVAAGFGAPLMKFTGFEAALLNAVGVSGIGKTTAAKVALSIFGSYDKQKLVVDDTPNATLERIALAGSLPVYIDEITNIDSKLLSNFVYRITQGRGKLRLTEKAMERTPPEWNTIVMSSSNASLIARLSTLKLNAEAEMLRVFEFHATPVFDKPTAKYINDTVRDNFGLAGPVYIDWLVRNQETVKVMLDRTITSIEQQVGGRPNERYWCAVVGVAIVGGLIAQRLGLVQFDIGTTIPWIIRQFNNLRGDKDEQSLDVISILGTYLNASAGTRLVVSEQKNSKMITVHRQPAYAIHQRMELDTNTLWIDSDHFKRWLAERSMDIGSVKKELVAKQISPPGRTRRVIGAGTDMAGAQVDVLKVDLKHPAMGQMLTVVADTSKPLDTRETGS